MLLGREAIGVRALGVSPEETSAAPAPPAFAALEARAIVDLVYLVDLYPLQPAAG